MLCQSSSRENKTIHLFGGGLTDHHFLTCTYLSMYVHTIYKIPQTRSKDSPFRQRKPHIPPIPQHRDTVPRPEQLNRHESPRWKIQGRHIHVCSVHLPKIQQIRRIIPMEPRRRIPRRRIRRAGICVDDGQTISGDRGLLDGNFGIWKNIQV